jgi:hypothetical protein
VAGWGLGNVNLVGDANANDITVNLSPNGINITGNNGTTLTLTPPPAGWLVVLNTPTNIILVPPSPSFGQLFIDLKAGDDVLGVFGPDTLMGSLIVLPGDGNDQVNIGGIRTMKQLAIRETTGNDVVVLDAVYAHDPSLISLNLGNDKLTILGSGTQFDSDLTILTGAGSDMVRFSPGQSLIQGNLLIDTSAQSGDGGDSVLVDYSTTAGVPTLKVLGNTTIRTGDGADLIRFGLGSGIGPSVELGAAASNTIIEMGNHNDRIFAARAKLQKLTARLQNGDDQVLNNWGAPLGGTTTVTVASGSTLDGGPHVSGDILPPGWTAPAGLTVVGFP